MKLFSYHSGTGAVRLGIAVKNAHFDLADAARATRKTLPSDMLTFLRAGKAAHDDARNLSGKLAAGNLVAPLPEPVPFAAAVSNPPSLRDAYAFRQHVATARQNRGLPMIPEFEQFPVFYFSNHNALYGPGDVKLEAEHFEKLDFELEVAAVLGRGGRNIRAEEADKYIAGFAVMNDFSARALQMEEMKLNLGPAKGKDFGSGLGPYLVTPDELEAKRIPSAGGDRYGLEMIARYNGKEVSRGNLADMNWTFAQIIERCAYGVDLFPGDVIGSGTVGTGCFLELNGTGRRKAEAAGLGYSPTWIRPGDTIALEVEGLGVLENRFLKAPGQRYLPRKISGIKPTAPESRV